MTSLSWVDDVDRPASELRSLLADRGGFFSNNPLYVPGDVAEAQVQLLAAVLLELRDRNCSRWVLQEQEPDAPGAGRWRFPGTAFSPGELPLTAGLRSVTEKLVVLDAGLPMGWAELENRVLSVAMDWLPELRMALAGACQLEWASTLVFTYHTRMQVPDTRLLELRDITTRYGRRTWLAGILDIQACIAEGTLCPVSEQLWKNYWVREGT